MQIRRTQNPCYLWPRYLQIRVMHIIYILKEGCLFVGLACLCLCASPTLAVLVPDVGPAPPTLSAHTATTAAWIATCMTSAWFASDSAISVCL